VVGFEVAGGCGSWEEPTCSCVLIFSLNVPKDKKYRTEPESNGRPWDLQSYTLKAMSGEFKDQGGSPRA